MHEIVSSVTCYTNLAMACCMEKEPTLSEKCSVPAKAEVGSVKVLFKYLEKVFQTVGGYVEYLDGTPKCMFFQDSHMKDLFNFFPDRVCINCSFKKFDIDMFTVVFLSEDSNGRNCIVAVGFMHDIDIDSVAWVLTSFKKHNPNWNKINSLAVDPRLQHWEFVKEIFSSAKMIISAYHAISTFNNYVFYADSLKTVPIAQKKFAALLFKDLLYAPDNSEFETRLQKYYALPEPLVSYLREVWWPPIHSWRILLDFTHEDIFEARNLFLLEFNNAIETLSEGEKSYVEYIKKLFLLILLKKREKPSLSLQPVKFLYSRFSPQHQICTALTPYAAKFVIEQLQLSQGMSVPFLPLSDFFTFNHLGVTVQASADCCNCPFYMYTHLPCRHMFCVRQSLNVIVFDSSHVDNTWSLRYYEQASGAMQEYLTSNIDSRIPHDLTSRTALASHLFEIAPTLLLDKSEELFESRINVLKNLNQAWKTGDDASVKFIGLVKSVKKDNSAMLQDSELCNKNESVSTSEEVVQTSQQTSPVGIAEEPCTSQITEFPRNAVSSFTIKSNSLVVDHETKRASRQRLSDISHCLLKGKHINLACIVNKICSTKESCVNWLKSQGFLLTSMKCSSCQGEMISKHLSRLNDGIVWRCPERKCLGKKSSVRFGTWFNESNLTLQQMLIFTYMWLNKFTRTRILFEMPLSANNYVKWDKFHCRVCEESMNADSFSVDQAGPSNYKDTLDNWLQNHSGRDTFLEFLKDAAEVYRKEKLSLYATAQ